MVKNVILCQTNKGCHEKLSMLDYKNLYRLYIKAYMYYALPTLRENPCDDGTPRLTHIHLKIYL